MSAVDLKSYGLYSMYQKLMITYDYNDMSEQIELLILAAKETKVKYLNKKSSKPLIGKTLN